jgi:glyoxylase I family protein
MPVVHHTAICVADIETSLRFWCDGLGLSILMDERFEGDWPTLLRAPTTGLHAVFLGDQAAPDAGIIELVDLGAVDEGPTPAATATTGVLLVSVMTDLDAALGRLRALGLGGEPRRITVHGVAMAVVADPDGVLVELVDTAAVTNLERMARGRSER